MTIGVGIIFLKENANNILSINPKITFFKKVFVRHTNFAQETFPESWKRLAPSVIGGLNLFER